MSDAVALAAYAVSENCSRGRQFKEAKPQYRSEFQRDRDRIVHSAAFRRLEYKTQVFVNHEGDLFRTRLTHSLEVAQIGRSVARTLRLNEDLTESIALAHDLGHTPFGHAGQDALNKCMRDYGGFEHNLQSLRIVEWLEQHYADFDGLNLCYETREGILKHCSMRNAKSLGQLGQRFIDGLQPSLEAQLTNIADEIAYNNHDVDDGLRAKLLSHDDLLQVTLFKNQYAQVTRSYPGIPSRRIAHEVVRRMINQQVVDLIDTSLASLAEAAPENLQAVISFGKPLIHFSASMAKMNGELKTFLRENLYRHYRVHRMAVKAQRIITALFAAFMQDPQLLPSEPKERLMQGHSQQTEHGKARTIADYIAGMTDRYAIGEYERLFSPLSQP